MNNSKWIVKSVTKDKIPFEQIFNQRNIYNMDKYDFFLPKTNDIYDPYLMKGMKEAVEKVNKSISKNEKICIYGDYDVDGISATTILLKTFKILGYKNISYYIPIRKSEGYGLNNKAIEKLNNDSCKLIITVDCGITSFEQVEYANNLGMDIIVTDHHQIQEKIPEAQSIINPHQKDCKYPFKNLCGAAIAYKLAKAILISNKKQETDELIELAGIATVADVMEINGENRVMVKKALEMIKKAANKSIDALLKVAQIDRNTIDTYTIGFQIGPRINSAGRIGNPKIAVEFLTSEDDKVIESIAKELNDLNKKRKQMQDEELKEALIQAQEQKDDYIIIVYSEKFEKGIVGLVASKLTKKYNKPSIVMAVENDEATGSCRSIESLNIEKSLEHCSDLLIKFGGHKMAAGLSIKKENIPKFKEKIEKYLRTVLTKNDFIGKLYIDSMIPVEMINRQNCIDINKFEPFGISNPDLLFMSREVEFEQLMKMGTGKHIKAKIKNTDASMIKFNADEELIELDTEKKYDIVYTINENIYNNYVNIQAMLEDIRVSKDIDYGKIFSQVKSAGEYFKMDYEFSLMDIVDFKKINFKDIYNLEKNTLFLCYTYSSYDNLCRAFEVQDKYLGLYTEDTFEIQKNMVSFIPLLETIEIDMFENIVVMDDIKNIEQIIYHTNSKKYIIDKQSYNLKYEKYALRDKMVLVYNYFRINDSKETLIQDVLKMTRINPAIFFISCSILEISKLIDIKYDFKYNKVYAKIINTNEKKKLDENILYNKFDRYIKLLH